MICLTGAENNLKELAKRLNERNSVSLLQEVRADFLEEINDELFALIRGRKEIIFTFRPRCEGGAFKGEERERARIFEKAIEAAPGYIDIELSAPQELKNIALNGRARGLKIISSAHINQYAPELWADAAKRLTESEGDILKFAVFIKDSLELADISALFEKEGRPTVKIGMSEAGLYGRALFRELDSPFTYVAYDKPVATGQLTFSEAKRLALFSDAPRRPVFIVGGVQTARSHGIKVYNRLFERQKKSFIYLPFITTRYAPALDFMKKLNFAGASITMPAKIEFLPLVSRLTEEAKLCGAVNTFFYKDGMLCGHNTDGAGALSALSSVCEVASKKVLILGAGGAARGIAIALFRAKARLCISARRRDEAKKLLALTNGKAIEWEERAKAEFDILVNATPVGGITQEGDPLEGFTDWRGKIVLDAVSNPSETPLLKRASLGGAKCVSGVEMWIWQGIEQMKAITDSEISYAEMREALDE